MSYKIDASEVVVPGPNDVQIQPNELVFQRPLKKRMQQLMYIKNTNPDPNLMLAFKVKTTKQDGYTVQKPSGDIMSGEERLITVTLQDLTGSDKPDKFLLQFVLIPAVKPEAMASVDGKPEPADTVFKQWSEEAMKRKIYQKKLFVWFPAEGQTVGSQGLAPPSASTPQRSSSLAAGSSLRPETPQHDTTQPFHSPQSARLTTPTNNALTNPSGMHDTAGINKSVSDTRPATASTGSATTDAPHTTVTENLKGIATASSIEELKMQLAEARAHIASLGGEAGLRLRKAGHAVGVEDVVPAVKSAIDTGSVGGARAEGVPVHIVALLCLLSFLIAYFFF